MNTTTLPRSAPAESALRAEQEATYAKVTWVS